MATPIGDDLDGVSLGEKYPDGTLVRVFCLRTDRDAYPCGWAYKLHYGTTDPDPPRTLGDGTIRRYDNSHEDTKGHEHHTAAGDLDDIEFPGMEDRLVEFWASADEYWDAVGGDPPRPH
jgi:hypothetical protein